MRFIALPESLCVLPFTSPRALLHKRAGKIAQTVVNMLQRITRVIFKSSCATRYIGPVPPASPPSTINGSSTRIPIDIFEHAASKTISRCRHMTLSRLLLRPLNQQHIPAPTACRISMTGVNANTGVAIIRDTDYYPGSIPVKYASSQITYDCHGIPLVIKSDLCMFLFSLTWHVSRNADADRMYFVQLQAGHIPC